MAPQTRSGATYQPSAAAPQQQHFTHRRKTVKKTYAGQSKKKSKPALDQGTLTQFDFTSSSMRQQEDEPPQSRRRKTLGDEVDEEQQQQPKKSKSSKRRKTFGDSPTSSNDSGSFHTQTLTQMLSMPPNPDQDDADPWAFDGSDEVDPTLETPRKASSNPHNDAAASTVPSLVESATPVNRQKKLEIPSSTQSPTTPSILRFTGGPTHSPLIEKSANIAMPSPILKKPGGKIPRTAVIPDTYSTTHESSPLASSPKSAVKATPSKRLRFDLPEDKENVTPGRTKPKSPRPPTSLARPSGRRGALLEIPDSDEEVEDSDETVSDSEDEDEDEFGANAPDPESPTPKRFQNAIPSSPVVEDEDVLEEQEVVEEVRSEVAEEDVLEEQEVSEEVRSEVAEEEAYREMEDETARSDIGEETQAILLSLASPRQNTPSAPDSDDLIPSTPTTNLENHERKGAEPEEIEQNASSTSQGYAYTQGLESQRVPLDAIHALGPQTPRSDIMVSLHPEHVDTIVNRSKNHEFRAWKIPPDVSRIWIYITRPASQLKYMCIFGPPKAPGEIEDQKGLGNVEFNLGKQASKYAYEILQVYELNNPVSLDEMKAKGWVAGAPQKFTFIPPAVVGELTANLRCALFEEAEAEAETGPSASNRSTRALKSMISESQELRAQLQSDVEYNTQHYSSEMTDEIVPSSQSPQKETGRASIAKTDEVNFARPALPTARSNISSTQGLPPFQQRQFNPLRPSQATTVVSQTSTISPAVSPERSSSGPRRTTIIISSQSRDNDNDNDGSPARRLFHRTSSLHSSQFATRSQMLPDSLLNDDISILEPPPIIWDSADEMSD